jgi:hypothetical protein
MRGQCSLSKYMPCDRNEMAEGNFTGEAAVRHIDPKVPNCVSKAGGMARQSM